jgi:Cu2+-exporting ATPase
MAETDRADDSRVGEYDGTADERGGTADGGCHLCDLPTGDDPVTAADVDGDFCCQGCLTVARHLDATGDSAAAGRAAGDSAATGRAAGDSAATGRAADDLDELDTGPDADAVEGAETFLAVEGMHCSTCESFLEARATDREGVRAAEASYASDLLRVVHDADTVDADALAETVSGVGYDAREVSTAADAEPGGQRQEAVGRLLVGGFFGMLVMLWYVLFLYPTYLGVDPDLLLLDVDGQAGRYLLGNVWVMATVVLGYTGYPILRGAYVSLRAGEPNMDLLVALAAVTAYTYSTLAALTGQGEVYFDVSVVVVLAVTIGGYYERRVKDRATGELAELTTDRVERARRRTGDGVEDVSLEAVTAGDDVVVRTGERVPLDGRVAEGEAAVDEALVTGESVPVRKTPDDEVVGGAQVTDGGLVVAVDEHERNTLDRIARRLWELQTGRRGAQRLVDRLAGVFVPLVLAVATLAAAAHLALGATPTGALLTGLAVLVVSCPCALGLATPLSVAAGVRDALAAGIVVTDESAFERATDAEVVAFDKTGTLTTGDLELDRRPDDDLLADAAAVEQFADHPLAVAVTEAAGDLAGDGPADSARADSAPADRTTADSGAGDPTVTDVEHEPGRGVVGTIERSAVGDDAAADAGGDGATGDGGADTGDERRVAVGHPDLFAERGWAVSEDLRSEFDAARERGSVAALVGRDGRAEALVSAADTPREGWETVLSDLAADREVVVITGDEGGAATRYREHDAVSDVFAGVPPEAKGEVVARLRERGPVAMVGDGSNDAPALAAADVGIAFAEGTALAADAADAVVTTGDLATVPEVFELTRATRRRIRENVGWALCYNGVAVPAAAAGLLNPLVAAVAMAGSSLLVVTNASRSLLE